MKVLLIHACEPNVKSWMSGDFINNRTVVVWTEVSEGRWCYWDGTIVMVMVPLEECCWYDMVQ